jgi:hypothetical protein
MSGTWQERDQSLHAQLLSRNQELRAALCTMARIGVAFRQAEPERAREWADRLAPHPLYKAGQFLFDLTEWEDFMLDGPPPAAAAGAAAILFLRAARLLGVSPPDPSAALAATDMANLPQLEPGFYLYRDVVLGLVSIALLPITHE